MLKKSFKPLLIFYILLLYTLSSQLWWSYLLLNKTKENYTLSKTINNTNQKLIKKKFEKQKIMIIGESIVFFFLLIIGSIQVYKSFNKEFLLKKQQKNFLLSITHELRSPLSSIKLALQTLLNKKVEQEQSIKLLNNSLSDIQRLNILVDNILLASKLENHAYQYHFETINFSEIITKTIKPFSKKITTDIKPNIYILGDAFILTSLVYNLVENALKYGKTDVNIKLFEEEGTIIFKVSDKGIGIEDVEKKLVFDKFYRIGNEETRSNKGTGLGLYIVNKITEKHNARLKISDNSPTGCIIEVSFLKQKQA